MIRRALYASTLVGVLLAGLLPIGAAASTTPPPPASIAAVGDSISQAASTGGSLGADYPANAWSTGTNPTVNSHYLRLLALNPSISGRAWNNSVSGAKMADLQAQMQVTAVQRPDYVTVLVGGNDLCTDTVAGMTDVTVFRAQFVAAMDALTAPAASPATRVYVVSIPNAYQLWQLFRNNWWARTVWSLGRICQSLLANPTSNQTADVQRRETVRQRNIAYNTQLAQVCALYPQCRFDNNAVFNTAFTSADVSGDYFHPSTAGQAKLAAVSWAAGYWPNGGPAPDAPPTASFTASCTDLTCVFDATASSDDQGIASYAWSFGDAASGGGATPSHTYASDGTYPVTLTVTDTAGQTAVASGSVTVAAGGADPTVHLASTSGSSTTRKGGWTARVTVIVRDGAGTLVAGAVVTGAWTGGASGGCTTGTNGSCAFSLNVGRKTASVTWTIGSITAAGYAYDAASNVGSPVVVAAP